MKNNTSQKLLTILGAGILAVTLNACALLEPAANTNTGAAGLAETTEEPNLTEASSAEQPAPIPPRNRTDHFYIQPRWAV